LKHFNQDKIINLPSRYRAQLVNCLSGFKSANLIATCNEDGQTNVAIFSSVVHLGASPALVGFVMRPDNVERHTLENIKQTKQYTINQVNESFWQQAHQTSARYLALESEFDLCGLSSRYIEGIEAPFVNESQLQYALTLKEIIPIKLNNTLLVIGQVTDIFCPDTAIKQDGYIDIESLNTVALTGLDSYHVSQRLSRLSYAKPDKSVQRLAVDGQSELGTL
jgi:flavin reductase (DIM6/NTAB) family NADH-FMN oxidoreductase RutF